MTEPAKLFRERWEIDPILSQLGLTEQILRNSLMAGLLARREATRHHPKTAPGFNAWSEGTMTLRAQVAPLGWENIDEFNQGLVFNPNTMVTLAIVQGDRKTGIPLETPSTKSKLGPNASAAVRSNTGFLFPEMEPKVIARKADQRDYWLLLVYVDVAKEKIRAELSRPIKLENRKACGWDKRIFLESIDFSEGEPLKLPSNNSDSGPSPEIVVEVKRRA